MGIFEGGSAKYFATIFDMMGHGRVVTMDIKRFPNWPQHPRIAYLVGSSTSEAIVSQINHLIQPGERVMVTLDSDHHKAHVLEDLRIYSQLVTPGQYLVVEDTNINGHPVQQGWGEGPAEAVAEFLRGTQNYRQDRSREKSSPKSCHYQTPVHASNLRQLSSLPRPTPNRPLPHTPPKSVFRSHPPGHL